MQSPLEKILSVAPHIDRVTAQDWLSNTEGAIEGEVRSRHPGYSGSVIQDVVGRKLDYEIGKLKGFSCFEIGVLYVEYMGGFYPFEASSQGIVSEKLGVTTPARDTGLGHRRATLLPEAKSMFLEKLSAQGVELVAHREAYQALDEFFAKGGAPDHEWINPGPGSIYKDSEGRALIVDFKFPSNPESLDLTIHSPLPNQLASMALRKIALEEAGVAVDTAYVCGFDMVNWDVQFNSVELPESLLQDVKDAGDKYWDCVLSAEMPQRSRGNDFQSIEEVPRQMRETLCQVILAKKLNSLVKKMDTSSKTRLLAEASSYGIDWDQADLTTRVPGIDIKRKTKSTKLNEKLIGDLIQGKDVDPASDEYVRLTEETSLNLIRAKKGPHAEMIERFGDLAQQVLDMALEDARSEIGLEGFDVTEAAEENFDLELSR